MNVYITNQTSDIVELCSPATTPIGSVDLTTLDGGNNNAKAEDLTSKLNVVINNENIVATATWNVESSVWDIEIAQITG